MRLFQRAAKQGATLRLVISSIASACDTVFHAHARGVVHCDLKPHNIMLSDFGQTYVLDWGLAISGKRLTPSNATTTAELPWEGDFFHTRPGGFAGTPAFMSPEQADVRIADLGPASDVYSLGATLYVVLVGKPAYHARGDLHEVLTLIREGVFPAPRVINKHICRDLEAICLKAMSLTAR